MKAKPTYIRIVAYIPADQPELYERLRLEAFRRRKSISKTAGELIEQGLTKAEQSA